MPYCSVLECKNDSRRKNLKNGGVSYHRFPKDASIKEKWIDATGRVNWMPTNSSTICSEHFLKVDLIISNKGNRYMKPTALPSKKIINFFIKQENDNVVTAGSSKINSADDKKMEKYGKLQCQLRFCKEKIAKQGLKIKQLQSRNRRLKQKIKNMNELLLLKLKENFAMTKEDLDFLKDTNLEDSFVLIVQELVARDIRNTKSGVTTRRKYSIHQLDYVRKTFHTSLPHIHTLKNWYMKVRGESRFTKEALACLKQK